MKPLALFLAFFSISISAKAAINCTEYLRRNGAFQYQRMETNSKECFLGVDPTDIPAGLIYRGYLVTDDGMLMVFNSYNDTESSDATGARVFYFFPRGQDPDMAARRGFTAVKTASPLIDLNLSTDQAKIVGMKGGKVKESGKVSPSNAGGVEFSHVQTLYLDAGFTLGKDPTSVPTRSSKFIDVKNNSCVVKNSEIFKYSSDGDSSLKFDDNQLKEFLSSRCPNLKMNF